MAAKKKVNGQRRLRSREWFDAPGDPTMAALYLERYMNFGDRKSTRLNSSH